uniref:Phosphodiesterase n=1 Tax=Phlebotomus papatasi TaxID=29031 RepID=A0A1B0D2T1_PHLPP
MRGVMAEAKDLAQAERCSLFLIDKYTGELVSKVFDGNEATEEFRIENGQGIAGHVANTGKLLNIRNAYQHSLFYKGVDEVTGFKTRNILCFPICDEENIIGVAQLCNKANGFHFDKCDEEIATAFSIYCGISIMHALVHERVQKAEARHKLSQELLLHHMKVPEDDVKSILQDMQTSRNKIDFNEFTCFTYCPREIDKNASIHMSFEIFSYLKLVHKFKIPKDKFLRFLLLVQKGYRDMPYHNWTHAFSALAFLIACLCHDLDHRGTNNSYQKQSRSPLAKLYSSEGSVNERHHLSQAICILNDANCKILDSLDNSQFKECIDVIGELILATDLAQHFRILANLRQLTPENLKEKPMHLLSLMMTCCDLSDQVKPWPTTQIVAELVYAEFFAQGDLEKEMGLSPKEMMDRQKACIPELQIEFITTVVRPTFEILANIFPTINICLDTIDNNRRNWEILRDQQSQYCLSP